MYVLMFVSISLQVCDEPHPLLVKEMMQHCINGNIAQAYKVSHIYLIVNPIEGKSFAAQWHGTVHVPVVISPVAWHSACSFSDLIFQLL